MNINYKTTLSLKYQLTPDAPMICMPELVDDVPNRVILRSKINFSLAHNGIMEVPTGVIITSFPVFVINPQSPEAINMFTEACCKSEDSLLVNYGLRVLGPQSINKSYNREIHVIVKNEDKSIFTAEAGDEIAILEVNLKPMVMFDIDIDNHNIPKELR